MTQFPQLWNAYLTRLLQGLNKLIYCVNRAWNSAWCVVSMMWYILNMIYVMFGCLSVFEFLSHYPTPFHDLFWLKSRILFLRSLLLTKCHCHYRQALFLQVSFGFYILVVWRKCNLESPRCLFLFSQRAIWCWLEAKRMMLLYLSRERLASVLLKTEYRFWKWLMQSRNILCKRT